MEGGIYGVTTGTTSKPVSLVHRPTGDQGVIDPGLGIDGTWEVADNYDDLNAMLIKSKVQKLKCKDFFKLGTGPFRVKQWRGACDAFDKLAAKCLAETSAAKKAAAAPVVEKKKEDFQTPTKTKQADRLRHGRELLAAQKQEAEKKRRCSLA